MFKRSVGNDVVTLKDFVTKQVEGVKSEDWTRSSKKLFEEYKEIRALFNLYVVQSLIGYNVDKTDKGGEYRLVKGGWTWKALPTKEQFMEILDLVDVFIEKVDATYLARGKFSELEECVVPKNTADLPLPEKMNKKELTAHIEAILRKYPTAKDFRHLAALAEKIRRSLKWWVGGILAGTVVLVITGGIIKTRISRDDTDDEICDCGNCPECGGDIDDTDIPDTDEFPEVTMEDESSPVSDVA